MLRYKTLHWQPFPSIIDGIKFPVVFDKGIWKGVLNLVVFEGFEGLPGTKSYGIKIACEVFLAVEERIYSMAHHGDNSSIYDGSVYIKEAVTSQLISAYTDADYLEKVPRHFLFVGLDYSFECLSFSSPEVFTFGSMEEGYGWHPSEDSVDG